MATSPTVLHDLVMLFVNNETRGGEYGPLTEAAPDLTMAEAYAVQRQAVDALCAAGARRTGIKIAATNDGSQKMLGLDGPAYGELLDRMVIPHGGSVSAGRFANGRIECELAFRLGKALDEPGVDSADVLAAVDAVMAAFELVDLRNRGWTLGMAEVICYDGLAKHYVLAESDSPPDAIDLVEQTATLRKNGEIVAQGDGTAVLGDPLAAMAWLANTLIAHGRPLQPGDIVLTGSMTPPQPMAPGDRFEADFPGLGSVAVTITE
jgi:2-keto-4-pentenoate hydratase